MGREGLGEQWIQKEDPLVSPKHDRTPSWNRGHVCHQVTGARTPWVPSGSSWSPLPTGVGLEREEPWGAKGCGDLADLLDSRDLTGLGPGTRLKESRADGRCQVAGMASCVLSPVLSFPSPV